MRLARSMERRVADREEYYRYRQRRVQVRGDTFTFFTRPALGGWRESLDPALLLAEWVDAPRGARVLQLHCGYGLSGAIVARRIEGSQVTLLDHHCVAVEAARRTLDAYRVPHVEVLLSDSAQAVRDRRFDCVIALQPKGRLAWEQTILDAAAVLRTGGVFYLAGTNRGGIKSAARFVERAFGNVTVLAYRGGCRVLRATKQDVPIPASNYYTWAEIAAQVCDERLAYVSKPGLFSWDRLDGGTRLLIEAMQDHPLRSTDQVLDVGCGSGVLTLFAALQAREGHVIGVDVDCRAVAATRRTLALNKISNAEAILSDCGEAVQGRTFTSVVTNPPFHQQQATTYAIAEQIIKDAARLLEHGGRLVLVANSFLKYRPLIEAAFGNVTLLRESNRFKVWQATVKR